MTGEVACERGACLPAYECCKGAFDLVAIKGITEAGPWGFFFLQRGACVLGGMRYRGPQAPLRVVVQAVHIVD